MRDRLRALGPLDAVLAAATAAAAATAESAVGMLPLEDATWLAAVQARLATYHPTHLSSPYPSLTLVPP